MTQPDLYVTGNQTVESPQCSIEGKVHIQFSQWLAVNGTV
jgi:hypothetical protein